MHLILIGYMGSGKTAVGKRLATYLQRDFFDLDTLVADANGFSIAEIFRQKGELYFRKEEARILREFIDRDIASVLALGGGTPCYSGNMDFLLEQEAVQVIYLKTALSELCDRLWNERSHRPLIAHINRRDQLEEYIGKHLFERSAFYRRAHLIVETGGHTVDELCRKILLNLF